MFGWPDLLIFGFVGVAVSEVAVHAVVHLNIDLLLKNLTNCLYVVMRLFIDNVQWSNLIDGLVIGYWP